MKHSKPDPECYLLAATKLGQNPEDCIVFEDSFNGLISGRAAGAGLVALATTNPAAQLSEYTDMVVDSLGDTKLDVLFE